MRQKGKRHVLLGSNASIKGMHEDLNSPSCLVVKKVFFFFLLVLPEFLWQISPNHLKYLSLPDIQASPQSYLRSRDILEVWQTAPEKMAHQHLSAYDTISFDIAEAVSMLPFTGVFLPTAFMQYYRRSCMVIKHLRQEPQKPGMAQHLKLQRKRFLGTVRWGGHWSHGQCPHPFAVPNLASKDSLPPCEHRPNLHNNQSHMVLNRAFSTFPSPKYHYRTFLVHLFSGTYSNHQPCFPLLNCKLRRESWTERLSFPIF